MKRHNESTHRAELIRDNNKRNCKRRVKIEIIPDWSPHIRGPGAAATSRVFLDSCPWSSCALTSLLGILNIEQQDAFTHLILEYSLFGRICGSGLAEFSVDLKTHSC